MAEIMADIQLAQKVSCGQKFVRKTARIGAMYAQSCALCAGPAPRGSYATPAQGRIRAEDLCALCAPSPARILKGVYEVNHLAYMHLHIPTCEEKRSEVEEEIKRG